MSDQIDYEKINRHVEFAKLQFASASELVAYRLIVSNRQPTEAERAEWTASYNAWREAVGDAHAILLAESNGVAQ